MPCLIYFVHSRASITFFFSSYNTFLPALRLAIGRACYTSPMRLFCKGIDVRYALHKCCMPAAFCGFSLNV